MTFIIVITYQVSLGLINGAKITSMICLYLRIVLFAAALAISNCTVEYPSAQQYQISVPCQRDTCSPSFWDVNGSYPSSFRFIGFYLDSLPYQMFPECMHEYYTRRKNKISMIHFIDTISRTNIVEGMSANAQSGFLSINARIARIAKDSSLVDSCFHIVYIVNNNEVKTRGDVKNLVRLKESEVHSLEVIFNRAQKEIMAFIFTNRINRKRSPSRLQ